MDSHDLTGIHAAWKSEHVSLFSHTTASGKLFKVQLQYQQVIHSLYISRMHHNMLTGIADRFNYFSAQIQTQLQWKRCGKG